MNDVNVLLLPSETISMPASKIKSLILFFISTEVKLINIKLVLSGQIFRTALEEHR